MHELRNIRDLFGIFDLFLSNFQHSFIDNFHLIIRYYGYPGAFRPYGYGYGYPYGHGYGYGYGGYGKYF